MPGALATPCGAKNCVTGSHTEGYRGDCKAGEYFTAGWDLHPEGAKRENWPTSYELGAIMVLTTVDGTGYVHRLWSLVSLTVNELIQTIPALAFVVPCRISGLVPSDWPPILVRHVKIMPIRKQDIVRHLQNFRLNPRFNIVLIPREQPHRT